MNLLPWHPRHIPPHSVPSYTWSTFLTASSVRPLWTCDFLAMGPGALLALSLLSPSLAASRAGHLCRVPKLCTAQSRSQCSRSVFSQTKALFSALLESSGVLYESPTSNRLMRSESLGCGIQTFIAFKVLQVIPKSSQG